jgi:hypothetical protein
MCCSHNLHSTNSRNCNCNKSNHKRNQCTNSSNNLCRSLRGKKRNYNSNISTTNNRRSNFKNISNVICNGRSNFKINISISNNNININYNI